MVFPASTPIKANESLSLHRCNEIIKKYKTTKPLLQKTNRIIIMDCVHAAYSVIQHLYNENTYCSEFWFVYIGVLLIFYTINDITNDYP